MQKDYAEKGRLRRPLCVYIPVRAALPAASFPVIIKSGPSQSVPDRERLFFRQILDHDKNLPDFRRSIPYHPGMSPTPLRIWAGR